MAMMSKLPAKGKMNKNQAPLSKETGKEEINGWEWALNEQNSNIISKSESGEHACRETGTNIPETPKNLLSTIGPSHTRPKARKSLRSLELADDEHYLGDAQRLEWLLDEVELDSRNSNKSKEKTRQMEQDISVTPTSSKSKEQLTGRLPGSRKKLFVNTEKELHNVGGTECKRCYEAPVPRDKIQDEMSSAVRDKGFAEVLGIVGEVPEYAKMYILHRRAATLPERCEGCKRWRAPFYRCCKCDRLLYGIHIEEHEKMCNGID